MSGRSSKVQTLPSLKRLTQRVRDDFVSGGKDIVLIFAHNSVGKTRLSMAFKDDSKARNKGDGDTLYYNAFTEDLFHWDNDLEGDTHRSLIINNDSTFFDDMSKVEMDNRIRIFLDRYADFDFRIDTTDWRVRFSRKEKYSAWDQLQKKLVEREREIDGIKISRGEENLFIWCFFLAVVQIALDETIEAYKDFKHIYIDDPISSLDENNAIAVAHDLAGILREGVGESSSVKVIVSSHHSLFFNVICNELKGKSPQRYFLNRPHQGTAYTLQATNDQPFFHHIAMLAELRGAADAGTLRTYHFNEMRGILERTARFFAYDHFSKCLEGFDDEKLFERALQLLSHRSYSLYDPVEMVEDTKHLFRRIITSYLEKYDFDLLPVPVVKTAGSHGNAQKTP